MKLLIGFLSSLLAVCAVSAQIVQFSGAPVASSQFLVQQFGTPGLLLSTTKENSSYGGDCMAVRRTTGGSNPGAIGWTGKECSTAAFDAFCNGTTCFLDTWYDQSGNGLNCTQATTARQPQVIKDTDNKISIKTTSTAQGCEVADNAAIRFATPEVYFIRMNPKLTPGDNQVSLAYTPTGTVENVARWGMLYYYSDPGPAVYYPRNGSDGRLEYGQSLWCGDGASFYLMNFRPATKDLRSSGGYQVIAASASTSVTYTGTIKLMVGNSQAYNQGSNGEKWRSLVIYDTAVSNANRNAINNYLSGSSSQNLTALPWTYTSADGFTWQTDPQIGYGFTTPDADGYVFQHEYGGFLWSLYNPTNVNNGVLMRRMEIQPGDEGVVAGNQRAEILLDDTNQSAWGKQGTTLPNGFGTASGFLSEFSQIYFEPGTPVTSFGWLFGAQHHTGALAEPDNITNALQNEVLQWVTSRNSSGTNRGSPIAYDRGVWYAWVIHAFWSASGTADTLEIWFGPNGGTLTKVVDITGSIFYTVQNNSIVKQGIYADSVVVTFAMRFANFRRVLTQNAYTSLITTQPSLATHPFLLKRDLDPASNDNTPMWLDQAA